MAELRIIGIGGMPEVRGGDDLAGQIVEAAGRQGVGIESGDILVVTQKVVSKAEGRIVHLGGVQPSARARQFAQEHRRDPRHIEVVLRESRRILRMERGIIISETHHGFVCANAGVDTSNLPLEETVALLPEDPDASAARIRQGIRERLGVTVGVIISDTFGRPWREGAGNVAIGVAGLNPLRDYRAQRDVYGHLLHTTVIAVADELASAAELVTSKVTGVPVALVKGYPYEAGEFTVRSLLREARHDLFR
ncbi:MAG: coenzyme F420-0:L-glutamate ligase [Dehalococcoidia bacterium]